MGRHIIHKQKIRLQISNQEDAHGIQNKVSELFTNGLGSLLEKTLDGIAPDDQLLRFESLNLNLGVISKSNFEQEFKEILVSRLRDTLITSAHNEEQTKFKPSAFEAMIHFLDRGTLPWYADVKDKTSWEKEMKSKATNEDWRNLIHWLGTKQMKQPAVVRRLILQFSDDFLERMILSVSPGWNSVRAGIFIDMQMLLKNVYGSGPADSRQEIWKYFLKNILSNSGTTDSIERQTMNILQDLISGLPASGDMNKERSDSIPPGIVRDAFLELKNKIIPEPEGVFQKKENEFVNKKDIPDSLFVKNSGIVILHPYLFAFFEELGLLTSKDFNSEEARYHAIYILHFLATGRVGAEEFDVVLEKILCGMPLEEPLPPSGEITVREKSECEHLLEAVIRNWPPLKNTSVEGLRNTFLQREGRLDLDESGWSLHIEKKTVDILLDRMPWGISKIKLPWMKNMLSVDWI